MNQQSSSILRVAVDTPLHRSFDYLPPMDVDWDRIQIGQRVRVPFRNKIITGMLMSIEQETSVPKNKLKQAEEVIIETPIWTPSLTKLLQFVQDYYHQPVGEVMMGLMPKWLREGRPQVMPKQRAGKGAKVAVNQRLKVVELNQEQQQASARIKEDLEHFHGYLIQGVTGSGKTEVYMDVVEAVLARGKQALILVPEIGLTPQTLDRFQQRFNEPAVLLHSGLSHGQRLRAWMQAKTASIVVGTRSAIFTPMDKLGLIIVDEEHDMSFKQQDSLRYSARDLSIVRGNLENIPVILGSATPSLESLHNAQRERYELLHLSRRASNAQPPAMNILDIRDAQLEEGLSASLLEGIQRHLSRQGQILLFINRRGYAPCLICHSCGYLAECRRCDVKLTLHSQSNRLHCHQCDKIYPLQKHCPRCGGEKLIPLGAGTERIEQALRRHFPCEGVLRIDADSTRTKGSMEEYLQTIRDGRANILIGTQMMAKGHDFPNLTLVAILDADYGLFSADFRAIERFGQIIVQVAGRAGRAEKPGEVIIQTRHPDYPLLQTLTQKGYSAFAKQILQEREQASLPPYLYMALIRAEAFDEQLPQQFLQQVKGLAQDHGLQPLNIMGPITAPMARRAGRHRAQLLIRTTERGQLQQSLKPLTRALENMKESRKVRWSLDVDPMDMM